MKISRKNIEKTINCLDHVFKQDLNFSGSYIRPLKMLDYNITNYDAHKVRTHLSNFDEILTEYFSFIHKWFPANPQQENTIHRCNELYVDKVTTRPRYRSFPKRKLANTLLKKSQDPSQRIYNIERIIRNNKYVVVEGNKGVGKTTFFNYWLNNRSKHLETNEKKIWFRVDASKLYGIWLKTSHNISFDLEAYHKIHSMYVTAKYGKNMEKAPALFHGWDHILDRALENENILSIVEELEQAIVKSDSVPDGRDTERFLDLCIKNNNIQKISDLYDLCYAYWLNNDYKILFIVDGIDNISWRREATDCYDKLCHEIGTLFINDFRKEYCDHFANIIIVVRPETFKDIESKNLADHLNTDNVKPYYRCIVAPTCAYNIFTHKSLLTQFPKSADILEFKKNLIELIKEEESYENKILLPSFEKELIEFQNFSESYLDGLMKAIRSRYQLVDKFYSGKEYKTTYDFDDFDDVSQILEIIFNDNIRACVDNFIENYATIKLAQDNKIPGAKNISRYPQYLLLNGRLFLDSPDVKTRMRGAAYPNIFWWNVSWTKTNQKIWFGLCSIRILQLLNELSEIRLSLVADMISSIFNLPIELVSKQIERMVKYGLIEYSDKKAIKDDYYISSTKKGKFILEFNFIFTDWLYFSALDTPLEKSLCYERDSRYIKIHRDFDYKFLNSFNTAYIHTVIIFFKHILTQHKTDNKNISNNWDKYCLNDSKYGVFRSCNHALSVFKFPNHFDFFVKRNIKFLFLGLFRRDKNEAGELLNNLIGLYPELCCQERDN